jgi:hypothetical protein
MYWKCLMREYRPCHSRKRKRSLATKRAWVGGTTVWCWGTIARVHPTARLLPSAMMWKMPWFNLMIYSSWEIGREIGFTSQSGSSSSCTLMQPATNLPPPQSPRKGILQESLALAEDKGLESKFRAATKCNKWLGEWNDRSKEVG